MKRLLAGILVLIAGLALMGFSFLRKVPVYDEDLASDEVAFYEETSEIDLTEYATFSGVVRSGTTGRLIINFDRSQPRGRAACPT